VNEKEREGGDGEGGRKVGRGREQNNEREGVKKTARERVKERNRK
jgi:hypothetical protein